MAPYYAMYKAGEVFWHQLPVTLEPVSWDWAKDVNHGEVVGYETTPDDLQIAVAWIKGPKGYVEHLLPSSFLFTRAVAVDEDGRVVGEEEAANADHVVIWTPGHKAIRIDGGAAFSEPYAVAETQAKNGLDTATVVGDISKHELDVATLWAVTLSRHESVKTFKPLTLGHLRLRNENESRATSINSSSWVVGYSDRIIDCPPDCESVASDGFIWHSGRMVALDSRLRPSDQRSWHVTAANTINDRGQVVAEAVRKGQAFLVLLNPV